MYIFISVLPILVITMLMYGFSSIYFSRRVAALIDSNLAQIGKNIESHNDAYRYLLLQIFGDESLFPLIRGFESGDATEKAVTNKQLKSRLFSLAFSKDEIQAITFIWPNLEISGYEKGIDSLGQSPLTLKTTKALLYEAGKKGGRNTVIPTMSMTYATPAPLVKNLFHLPLPYYDLRDHKLLGVLVLSIDERILAEICSGMRNSITFILDSNGRIVSFPVKALIGKGIEGSDDKSPTDAQLERFLKQNDLLAPGRTFINRVRVPDLGWTIVSVVSRDAFFREVDILALASFLLMGGLVFVSLFVIVVFTRRFSGAVGELVSVMRSAQSGNFVKTEKLAGRNDEFSYLARGFDEMIEEIHALMVKLQHERDAVYTETQKRKESEIRALEAQLNPHFLYNTLDCINWMAIEKNENEISAMVSGLGRILRYGISKSNGVVTVAEEVEWIRQYVEIQQVRFSHAFDLDLRVDPAVESFPVYKLLMQPFLENAIVHGFANVSGGGLLKIEIAPGERGALSILIQDNGCGMSKETLESSLSSDRSHIGISNAVSRIAAYYGDAGEVRIESEPGKGTRVSIRVPRPLEKA